MLSCLVSGLVTITGYLCCRSAL